MDAEKVIFKKEDLEKDAQVFCRDFDMFCDYLLSGKAKVSKKTRYISKNDCFELNRRLYCGDNFTEPTRCQNRYTVLHFMHYIALQYKILELNQKGDAFIQGKNYSTYHKASCLEKYFFWGYMGIKRRTEEFYRIAWK